MFCVTSGEFLAFLTGIPFLTLTFFKYVLELSLISAGVLAAP